MSEPEYTKEWLERNALFSCQEESCSEEVSFHANMLHLLNGVPVCENCYDHCNELHEDGEGRIVEHGAWDDLPTFNPFTSIKEAAS